MTRNVLSDYLAEIARIRATRAGTGEMSYRNAAHNDRSEPCLSG